MPSHDSVRAAVSIITPLVLLVLLVAGAVILDRAHR